MDEFERLADLGFFEPEERLELLEGTIVQKMTQHEPHIRSLLLTYEALRRVFGVGYVIRTQAPLRLGLKNRPEPDIAVVKGTLRDPVETPDQAILVVEIADSTLSGDRGLKAAIYAANGIEDYWIVNLPERIVEVYRTLIPMSNQPTGFGYQSVNRFTPGLLISPLAAPLSTIAVDDLLP